MRGGSRENKAEWDESSNQSCHRPQWVFPADSEEKPFTASDFQLQSIGVQLRLPELQTKLHCTVDNERRYPSSILEQDCARWPSHPILTVPRFSALISSRGLEPVLIAYDYVSRKDAGLVQENRPPMAYEMPTVDLPVDPVQRFYIRVEYVSEKGYDPVDGMYVNPFIPFPWPATKGDLVNLAPISTAHWRSGPLLPEAYQTKASRALFAPWRSDFDREFRRLVRRVDCQLSPDDAERYRLQALNELITVTLYATVHENPDLSVHEIWSFFVGAYRNINNWFLKTDPQQLRGRADRRRMRAAIYARTPSVAHTASRQQHKVESQSSRAMCARRIRHDKTPEADSGTSRRRVERRDQSVTDCSRHSAVRLHQPPPVERNKAIKLSTSASPPTTAIITKRQHDDQRLHQELLVAQGAAFG